MFAYCGNNPVNNSDPSGELLGAIVGGLLGGVCGAISAAISGDSISAGAATGAATGFVVGAACDTIATGGMNVVLGAAVCGIVSAIGNVANQYINYSIDESTDDFGEYIDYGSVITAGTAGALFAPLSAGGGKLMEVAFDGLGGAINEVAKGISTTISNVSVIFLQFIAEQTVMNS